MGKEHKDKKNKKPSRERKNPHSAEQFKAQRHERNLARGKQTWVENVISDGTGANVRVIDGGHWERKAA